MASFAVLVAAAALATLAVPARAQVPTGFTDELLAGQLDWPVGLAFLRDGRLLMAELKSARVRMIVDGSLASVDPIGVVDSVETAGEEEGLLALTVDPRWPAHPFVYVLFTSTDSTIRLARFKAAGDLTDASSGNLTLDPTSERFLIRDVQSLTNAHNGGALRFGPDSMLYASFGEDTHGCMAIDSTLIFGVLLRMDVRNLPDTPGPPNKALLVPASGNPYPGAPNVNTRLMYARGFRNPFRFHVDQPTGRVFIADVGFQTYEEVDVADAPGLNFGWPFYEGTMPVDVSVCGPATVPVVRPPVYEYNRDQYCSSCAAAIIGGVVFRHVANSPVSFPASYDGEYLFSDYYDGFIWVIRDSSGTWVKAPVAPGQPNVNDWARGYTQVSEYILGPDGAVYYAFNAQDFNSNTGQVRRIVHYNGSTGVGGHAAADVTFAPIYPTPSRAGVNLQFVLPAAATVRLEVFDALGRRVRVLLPATETSAGEHRERWDGQDAAGRAAAPGVYLAKLVVGDRVLTRRIALLR